MIDQEASVTPPGNRLGRIVGPHAMIVRNSSFVAIQMAIVGASGFLFWLIAAKRFPIADVGEAAALVSITLFVNYLTTVGLPVTVTRFASGRSRDDCVVFSWCVCVTTLASLIGSVALTALLSENFGGSLLAHGRLVAFVLIFLAVNGYSLVTLLDYRQLALGHQRVVLVRALALGIGRVIAVVAIPWSSGPLWIWAAMVLPTLLALAIGAFADRSDISFTQVRPVPADFRRIIRFSLANWASLLLTQAPFLLLPLVVLANVSAADNANFYLVWTMTAAAFLLPQVTGRMLLQEAHLDEFSLRAQASFSLRFMAAIAIVCLALALPTSFLIERVYGDSYAVAAQVLPLLILALLPFAVTTTVLNMARARERHLATVTVSLTLAIFVVIPARLVVDAEGLYGVSAAWLLGHIVSAFVALLVLQPLTREVASRRPVTLVGSVLIIAAIGLPMLMLGPTGAILALAVIAALWMRSIRSVPYVSAVLLGVAAVATLFEGRLVASLDFARDRPTASGAAGIAMGLLGAWALLGLSDQAVAAAATPQRLEVARPNPAATRLEKVRVLAAGLLGAVIGWVLDPGVSSEASQMVEQLNAGSLARGIDTALEPLVPLLVTVGPFTPRGLSAASLALALAVVMHSRFQFDRGERIVGLGLLALTVFVLRDDLGGLVALAIGVSAVSVALVADSWLEFTAVCVAMAAGCLASMDLVVSAGVVIVFTGFSVLGLVGRRVGAFIIVVAFGLVLGHQMFRWLDGIFSTGLSTVNPLGALLLTFTLAVPVMDAFRRRHADLVSPLPEQGLLGGVWVP